MFTITSTRIVKSLSMTVVVFCLTLLFQASAQADQLIITGSSDSQNPLVGSTGQVGFIGQAFNNNFNVTAVGQTFDFTFGQFQINAPTGVPGDSGCTDGPCLPITLTGTLTTPLGALSFSGFFEETDGLARSLNIDWTSGSGPFIFNTPEGGQVVFTIELLDFFAVNEGSSALLFNQTARVTVTQFTPGGQGPPGVPEPATMMLLGTGLMGLFAASRVRKRS